VSWSEKLKTLTAETARQGAVKLSRTTAPEGQLGKLLRRWASDGDAPAQPPPARFEPKVVAADSAIISNPAPSTFQGFALPPAADPSPPGGVPHAEGWRLGGSSAVALALKHQSFHSVDSVDGPVGLPELVPGDTVADVCEVERVVHRGPRFVVYLARHRAWNVPVAVKAPGTEALARQDVLEQITTAGLGWIALGLHPHVVYCHYVQLVEGAPALVLEWVDGGDLRSWIAAGRTANLRVGLNLAIQLCHGLEHVHGAGVRHGALIPAHVLVTGEGMVKIGNIGPRIAEPREPAGAKPSPARGGGLDPYRAPELWVDSPDHDLGADIFALGVCLYEMFCGHRPYEIARGPRREPAVPRFAHADEAIPERLALLLARCVDWERERRPAAEEVRAELCAAHEELFGRASPFVELPAGAWTADGLNNQALAALVLRDESAAEAAWENALQTQPLHVLASYNLGVARWRRGEITDQAVVRQMERVRSLTPEDWTASECLALVHLERGESSTALALLEEAAALAPASADVHQTLARLRSGGAAQARPTPRLRGHSGFVSAVGIGDAGGAIYSAGDDGTLRAWDAASGRSTRTLEAHGRRVSALSLSADGALALSASEEACLKLWELKSGRCLKTIATGGAVFCASISADGSKAAASSSGSDNFLGIDSTLLQVWDLNKDRRLGTLVGHTSAAKAIALSADGLTAVTGGDDHTVRVWDVTGSCKRLMEGHTHYVSCVLVCPDGEHVLSGSWDQTMRLWQIKTGRCLRVFGKTGAIVTSIAMTQDGRLAVSGCWDGTVRLWEVATGRCMRTFHSHTRMVTSVAVDPTGSMAVSSSWDSTVCVHALSTVPLDAGASVPKLSRQAPYACLPSAEPEPEELVEAAQRALREGKQGLALDRLRRAREKTAGAAHDGAAARLWRELSRHCRRSGLRQVRQTASWVAPGRIDAFRPLEDTNRVLVAGEQGLQVWEVDLNRCQRRLQGHAARVAAVAVGEGGRSALSGSVDGTLRWWDLGSGTSRVTMEGHASIVAAVALSDDHPRAMSGSYDHTARVWDLENGRCVRILRGHRRQVTAVCLSSDGSVCASGDHAGTILFWTAADSPVVLTGHTGRVTGLRFVSGTQWLLSSSCDGTLRLWEPALGRCVRVFEGHAAPVLGLDCTADGAWVVSSAGDGSLRLWELQGESNHVLAEGLGKDAAATLSEEDCSILVAGERGLHVLELEWDLDPAQ
jgi:WD40 repeat protein